ncbi:retrotransposon protein, putative, ty1-copia subclass [Tanacetum coccineum]
MDEIVHTYKARLVAKGYTQTYRVDYEEKFSPIADIRAIRILIAIAVYGESWKARMQGGSVEEGLCGDFVAATHFRQQRGDVAHLVSKDSKEVLVSSLEVK